MCSWCYAFQPQLTALTKRLPESIAVEYVLGGLAPDSNEPMPYALQIKLQNTWRRIEQTVPDISFNFDFWSNNTPIRSTYPACRAVLAAKNQDLKFEAKMIAAIQSAYYRQAQNPSLNHTLISYAAGCGVDIERFKDDLNNPSLERQLQDHLQLARSLSATSFPSLRLSGDANRWHEIDIDYLDYKPMLQAIDALIYGFMKN